MGAGAAPGFNQLRRMPPQEGRPESYYRALVAHSPGAIAVLDADGIFRFVSGAVTRISGCAPEDLIGTHLLARVHPDDVPSVKKALEDCVAESGHRITVECRGRRDSGSWQHEEWIAVNRLDDPVIRGIIVNCRDLGDVTERLRMEAQLREGQKMEAIGRLAGGIAHDFNNLLTVIIGYSDLALDQVATGAPVRSDLEEIRHAGESAAGLTRQLLAFSRKQLLQPQIVDLNAIVLRMSAMLRRVIGEDVELKTKLAVPLDRICADPSQIEQIIMNLALNARDAMPQGGSLTVETANVALDAQWVAQHPDSFEGRHVFLAISDTGVGMDQSVRTHLFEPFFTTKERGKGTGLGLATVYGIVKQSGGSIFVESEPERGTTFKMFLPRTEQCIDPLDVPRFAPPAHGGTETILVVEDQPEVRAVTRDALVRHGYTVLEAAGGVEALSLLKGYAGEVHLLVTDVVMPAMNGRELAERVAADRPHLHVLYTSGYTDDTVLQHLILNAGTAFLQKPFAPNELLQKVRDLLDPR
jgi:two-component system cell cycle sensor histidine kinase/response regulator CckA